MSLHSSICSRSAAQRQSWSPGFTLIELVMVISIIAILATLAIATYRVYVLKAESAQTLVYYDHIRTVVHIKTQVDGLTNLQQDSVPGAAPPALQDALGAREFNGPDNTTFQFILAPPGTFASYPSSAAYALVATASNANGVLRLSVLRSVLPFGDGDKIWIQASADASSAQLMYPIDTNASANSGSAGSTPPATAGTGATPPSSGTGSSSITGSGTINGNTWTASAHICLDSMSGAPLSGPHQQVIFQVVTQYANFQVNEKINPASGCVDYSYNGLPLSSTAQVSVVGVVNYDPSQGTSSPDASWDGVTPTLTIQP